MDATVRAPLITAVFWQSRGSAAIPGISELSAPVTTCYSRPGSRQRAW
jgi:hypothetical protein